jgi:RNA polymerase primary sigma factor
MTRLEAFEGGEYSLPDIGEDKHYEESHLRLVEQPAEIIGPADAELAAVSVELTNDEENNKALRQAINTSTRPEVSESLEFYMYSAAQTELLTAPQEVELSKRIERGDESARALMIESNLRLVISIAKKHIGRGVDFLDLIQDGNIGLITAVEKFDWRRGTKFSTYATWWIKQAVMRSIILHGRTIRQPEIVIDKMKRIRKVEQFLPTEIGRTPTAQDISDCVELQPDEVVELLNNAKPPVSLHKYIGEDQRTELGDLIEDGSATSPEESAIKTSHDEIIHRSISKLQERQRTVLDLRFGLSGHPPMTLVEVSKKLNLSDWRIRQLQNIALRALKDNEELADTFGEEQVIGSGDIAPTSWYMNSYKEPGKHDFGVLVLTEREVPVAELISYGFKSAQIANKLCIPLGTARVYMRKVYAKLGVTRAAGFSTSKKIPEEAAKMLLDLKERNTGKLNGTIPAV